MSLEERKVYTIRSGAYSVNLFEEEIRFISSFFFEIFQADKDSNEVEIEGGRKIISIIQDLRKGKIKKRSVKRTKLTMKYMLCSASNGEARMYKKAISEKIPIYAKIRREENEVRRIYSSETLPESPPDILVRFPKTKHRCSYHDFGYFTDNSKVIDNEYCEKDGLHINSRLRQFARYIYPPMSLLNDVRNSKEEDVFVTTFYDRNDISRIIKIPIIRENFCIAGGSVFSHLMYGVNKSDVDIFPIGCSQDTVEKAIVEAYNHLNTCHDVIVSRGKYAISFSYNKYGICKKMTEIADFIMKIFRFSYLLCYKIKDRLYDFKYRSNMGREELIQILKKKDITQLSIAMKHMDIEKDKWTPSVVIEGFSKLQNKLREIDLPLSSIIYENFFQHIERREIQFILQNNRTVSELLSRFDIDCCSLAIYKDKFYGTKRSIYSIVNRTNVIDPTRQSPSYIMRLHKYRRRGFGIFVPGMSVEEYMSATRSNIRKEEGLCGLVKYHSLRRKSDYASQTIFFENIDTLFDRVQEIDGIHYLFPEELLHSDYTSEMVGSINQRDGEFYNVGSFYWKHDESIYRIV